MKRRDFLKLIAVSPLAGLVPKAKEPTSDEIIRAAMRNGFRINSTKCKINQA